MGIIWCWCEACREDTPHDIFPRGYFCRECGVKRLDRPAEERELPDQETTGE